MRMLWSLQTEAGVLLQPMPGNCPHSSLTPRPLCELSALTLWTHLQPIIFFSRGDRGRRQEGAELLFFQACHFFVRGRSPPRFSR